MADHQQNTDTQHARVCYPLHPLAGLTLRIGKRRRGRSPTYYLVTHRNLGDAYMRLERPEDARDSYIRAKKLASKLLEVNPTEAATMSFVGLCEAKLGNTGEAVRLVAEATELAPQDPDVQYDAAVVHALMGDVDQALASLQIAIRHGFSRSEASVDDDLTSLHGHPEFDRLVTATQ